MQGDVKELSQVMLRKEESSIDDSMKEKKRYYEQIGRMQKECCKWVTFKNTEKCIEVMDKMEEFT